MTTRAPASETGRSGLAEPLPTGLERVLRRVVLEHSSSERRRSHTPLLHVGLPGAETIHALVADEPLDHALRADVVAAMVRRIQPRTGRLTPIVWLTRSGPLEVQDDDAAWLASAGQAYGEAGLRLIFVLVNRHGWADPRSGLRRTWVRLRGRS